jgi:hypothetical protein
MFYFIQTTEGRLIRPSFQDNLYIDWLFIEPVHDDMKWKLI